MKFGRTTGHQSQLTQLPQQGATSGLVSARAPIKWSGRSALPAHTGNVHIEQRGGGKCSPDGIRADRHDRSTVAVRERNATLYPQASPVSGASSVAASEVGRDDKKERALEALRNLNATIVGVYDHGRVSGSIKMNTSSSFFSTLFDSGKITYENKPDTKQVVVRFENDSQWDLRVLMTDGQTTGVNTKANSAKHERQLRHALETKQLDFRDLVQQIDVADVR